MAAAIAWAFRSVGPAGACAVGEPPDPVGVATRPRLGPVGQSQVEQFGQQRRGLCCVQADVARLFQLAWGAPTWATK